MYLCNCNGLSERAVRDRLAARGAPATAPGSVGELFGCFECRPQCGKCVAELRQMIDEARKARSVPLAAE